MKEPDALDLYINEVARKIMLTFSPKVAKISGTTTDTITEMITPQTGREPRYRLMEATVYDLWEEGYPVDEAVRVLGSDIHTLVQGQLGAM